MVGAGSLNRQHPGTAPCFCDVHPGLAGICVFTVIVVQIGLSNSDEQTSHNGKKDGD